MRGGSEVRRVPSDHRLNEGFLRVTFLARGHLPAFNHDNTSRNSESFFTFSHDIEQVGKVLVLDRFLLVHDLKAFA